MPSLPNQANDGFKTKLRKVAARIPDLPSIAALNTLRWPRSKDAPPNADGALSALEAQLSIPVPDVSAEQTANDTAFETGQFYARQERWRGLNEQLLAADAAGDATPTFMPVADLLAYGARADVVNAVDHALSEGLDPSKRLTVDGIMSLEQVRLRLQRAPAISTFVALAHLDLAWSFGRCEGRHKRACLARADAHHARARAILAEISDAAPQSAFILGAQCALYTRQTEDPRRMADDYARLIALNPANPRPMRALGGHMLATGGRQILELEARRTAAMVEDRWGAAGYAWVYFDALSHSDAACETVDVQFFLDGFTDIAERAEGQEMANMLAAYCSLALHEDGSASRKAASVRRELREASNWLIRNHLRELHPMVWAHAAQGFDNDAQVRSARRFAERGRKHALRVLADLFREELESGQQVVFTDHGPELVSS